MDTSNHMAAYDQAISLHETGRTAEAIEQLQAILNKDPNFALAHSALSFLFGKLQRYDEALAHARRVSEIEPSDPFSFVALSLMCQKAGQIREAEQAAMSARQLQVQAGSAP